MNNPDQIILWQHGFVKLNLTIVFTWVVMGFLLAVCLWLRRKITCSTSPGLTQSMLEVIVEFIVNQIEEISPQRAARYLPFVGTIFLFIAASNLLTVVPGYVPPTSSLTTTAALAFCVLLAVPIFGISGAGLKAYLKNYIEPSVFMLPFNIVGELSRTLALAVRLYGNMMSGTMIGAILLALVPFFVPVVMQLFGLLTGTIQAYIFSILAMVYIASAEQAHQASEQRQNT